MIARTELSSVLHKATAKELLTDEPIIIRTSRAWSYEPATQTAICMTAWEAVAADGQVVDRWQTEPIRLHCVFRFEMEHLLARVGFSVEAVYGDFFRHPLEDKSSEMIWVAQKPERAT